MGDWVAVSERLPEPNQKVLAYVPKRTDAGTQFLSGFVVVTWRPPEMTWHGLFYGPKHWYEVGSVSHWMPLPESPKGR